MNSSRRASRMFAFVVLLGLMVGCRQPEAPPTTAPLALKPNVVITMATPTPDVVITATQVLPTPPVARRNLSDSLYSLCWVAFSPTHYSPKPPLITPTLESLRADLRTLRAAGFTGLVTYGSDGITGRELPHLATEAGFSGLIAGVWTVPPSEEELLAIRNAALYTITVGYAIGNEGLFSRYSVITLTEALSQVRALTGLPVATTQPVGDYGYPPFLALGDWVFPNAHPYFSNVKEPAAAVAWTTKVYSDVARLTNGRPLLFKEVGLPSAGDPAISEPQQAQYYAALQQSPAHFVYFESFDQLWKKSLPVEPHWGLFNSDRSPKQVSASLCRK